MGRGLRDAAALATSLAAYRVIAFLTNVAVARALAPQELARFLLALSVSVVLIPVADFGISTLATRQAALSPHRGGLDVAGASVRSRAVWWALIVIASTSIGLAIGSPWSSYVFLMACTAVAQVVVEVIANSLLGAGGFAAASRVRIISAVATLGAVLLTLAFDASVGTILCAYAVGRLAPIVLQRPSRRLDQPLAEIGLRAGVPFAVSAILVAAYVRSDILLLGANGEPAFTIALYGVVYTFISAVQFLPNAFSTLLFQRMARSSTTGSGGPAELRQTRNAFGAAVGVALIVSVAMLLFGHWVIGLFGAQYGAEADAVRALFVLLVPISIGQIALAAMQAGRLEVAAARVAGTTFIVNVGLNATLIPLLGFRGALIATVAGETTSALLGLRAQATRLPRVDLACMAACVTLTGLSLVEELPSWSLAAAFVAVGLVALPADAFALRTRLRGQTGG